MRLLAIAIALGACSSGSAPVQPPPPSPRDARPAVAPDVADQANNFAALDAMFGGDGLIRGFDPAKVVGKSPARLKQALPSSFVIDTLCDDAVCAGEAPMPDAKAIRVGMMRMTGGNVGVSFELHGPELLHLYSRLETALGGSENVDKKTRVYTHDSLRYTMRADPFNYGVTIKIEKAVP
jgi:hypothetical protein